MKSKRILISIIFFLLVSLIPVKASMQPSDGNLELDDFPLTLQANMNNIEILGSDNELYIDPDYTDSLDQTFRSVSDIPIGVAVSPTRLRYPQVYRNIVAHHFSSITPENVMKMEGLVPNKGYYYWGNADLIVNFAEQINADVHGHTLVWHNQLPSWVNSFSGSSEDWKTLLKNHIQTVVGRYKGRIQSWDVINEAVLDSGSGYRNTIWFNNIGSEYIADAFRWAHEADPDAKLFYNDYSLAANSAKLDYTLSMITSLKEEGVPIHGIGFQMHINNDWPSLNQMQGAIEKVEELDLELKITEMDISMNYHETYDEFTNEIAQRQKERCYDVINLFLQSSNITGITFWGVSDANSWIPSFFGRKDWPLLFDTSYEPKPAAEGLLEALKSTFTIEETLPSDSSPSDSSGYSFIGLIISCIVLVFFKRGKRIKQ